MGGVAEKRKIAFPFARVMFSLMFVFFLSFFLCFTYHWFLCSFFVHSKLTQQLQNNKYCHFPGMALSRYCFRNNKPSYKHITKSRTLFLQQQLADVEQEICSRLKGEPFRYSGPKTWQEVNLGQTCVFVGRVWVYNNVLNEEVKVGNQLLCFIKTTFPSVENREWKIVDLLNNWLQASLAACTASKNLKRLIQQQWVDTKNLLALAKEFGNAETRFIIESCILWSQLMILPELFSLLWLSSYNKTSPTVLCCIKKWSKLVLYLLTTANRQAVGSVADKQTSTKNNTSCSLFIFGTELHRSCTMAPQLCVLW